MRVRRTPLHLAIAHELADHILNVHAQKLAEAEGRIKEERMNKGTILEELRTTIDVVSALPYSFQTLYCTSLYLTNMSTDATRT